HRVSAAAHGPEGVQLKVYIGGVGVLHNAVQHILVLQLLKFLVMVVVEKLHAVGGQGFAHLVVIFAAFQQRVVIGEEIHRLANILVADFVVVLDDGGQRGFVNGANVAADHLGAKSPEDLQKLVRGHV